ncbi:MAG: hypothetical protein IID31_10000 [Planctomycetes bacterium]|nr:hypothetical protein [Planctomycetota bacterium]
MAGITWLCWILGSVIAGLGVLWLGSALFRDRSRGRRRCPKCWYDMTGVPALTCPECGRESKHETRFFRTRRHRYQAAFAFIVLFFGLVTTRVPAVVDHGPFDFVPTPILRLVLGFFAEDAEAAYTARRQPIFPKLIWSPPTRPGTPAPPTTPTTWRERIEADWDRLLAASHARRLIYAKIRERRGSTAAPFITSTMGVIGIVLSDVDDERRIAIDAVRSLATRSDIPIEMRQIGIGWLMALGFDTAATRGALRSVARSKSAPPYLRLDAIDALQRQKAKPTAYIGALRELLVTPDPHSIGLEGYARRAIMCAARLPTEQAIAELLAAVESERVFTRRVASDGFQQLGAAAHPAVPPLVAAVNREASFVEMYALESLVAIGGPAAEALARLMRDGDPKRRTFIAVTIRRLNSRDPEMIELIAMDLLDSNVPFSRTLLSATTSHGTQAVAALEAIPVARQLEPRKRFVILYARSNHWSDPSAPVAALDDPDREVRIAVFDELRRMKWAADTISGSIVDALARATDPRDQRDLISIVRQFEIKDGRVIPLLRGRSGCEEAENLGFNALYTLDVMCIDREVVVDEAIRMLRDPYEQGRILATRVLGRAGADAARALGALRAAVEDEALSLAQPAAEAIESINEALRDSGEQSPAHPDAPGGP